MEQQTGSNLGKEYLNLYIYCIFSLWLFNLHEEYIMWNARLDEVGIKIAGRNINNLKMQMIPL